MKIRQELLSSVFKFERVGHANYRTYPPHICGNLNKGILFGGQIVSQSIGTLQEYLGKNIEISSLHHNFIAAGSGSLPLDYHIEELSNLYRIRVSQGDKIIGLCHVRVDKQFPSLPITGYPSPSTVLSLEEICTQINFPQPVELVRELIWEVRVVEWGRHPKSRTDRPRNLWWCRVQPDCSDLVPELSCSQLVLLLSDFMILQIAEDIYYQNGFSVILGASLSHNVRFHSKNETIRPTDWFLYRLHCETIGMDRCKLTANIFDQEGQALLSVIQEGYVRVEKRREKAKL